MVQIAALKSLRKLSLGLTMLLVGPQAGIAQQSLEPRCDRDPLYCAILALRPNIDKKFAYKLSNYIYASSKKHQVDPYRLIAIGMQESGLRIVNRRQSILLVNETCDSEGICTEYARKVTGYSDIGIFQFHINTIEAYGMDALRLRDDVSYATEEAARLLARKIKQCSRFKEEAWACYNSSTTKYRKIYYELVNRHYCKITGKECKNEN